MAEHPKIVYRRPWMYDKQMNAIFCEERISCCEASTKSGKTVACLFWILERALYGESGMNYWWIAPVYDQSRIAFDRLCRMLKNGLPSYAYKINRADKTVELVDAGKIWFKTASDPDNLYGEDVYGAVFDEASRASEDSWFAVRSTLTKTRGPVRLIGNVKGKSNWFYRLCRRAEREEETNMRYTRITWRDAVEAGIIDAEEIEEARRDYPPQEFYELYEAKANDRIQGAIFSYNMIDRARVMTVPANPDFFEYIVVSLDPGNLQSVSINTRGISETGIVVVARGIDGKAYVLADLSGHFEPSDWAREAVRAYEEYKADTIIAEVNQGGKLVKEVIKAYRPGVPVHNVFSSRGKYTRAEPVSAKYRAGMVCHVGYHDMLEEQLTEIVPGKSDGLDRADALVWGVVATLLVEDVEGLEVF